RWIRRTLGQRDVTGLVDEAGEFGVGDGVPAHPETRDLDFVSGGFLRVVPIRSHPERAPRDPDHRVGKLDDRRAGVRMDHGQTLPDSRLRHFVASPFVLRENRTIRLSPLIRALAEHVPYLRLRHDCRGTTGTP